MSVTRIFLGSSEELRADRVALGDFIGRLSDAYVGRGTRFSLVKWEHESIAVARHAGGKQAEYDDLVRGCDLALFLFHRRCGEYTLEELEVALEARSAGTGCSRVLVWLRALAPGERETPELERFRKRMDAGELGVAYRRYADVREVEMDLLDELAAFGATMEPRRVDGWVCVGDEALVDLGV